MEFPDSGGMFSTDVSAQINQSEQFKLPDMTGTKAILYLIPPKEVIPQYRRSINYRFGSNDIRRIENYLDKANTLGGITPKDSKLGGTCAECVLPSANAEPINTNVLAGSWTFVLVLDINNPYSKLIGNDRVVYTGYVQDDPIELGIVSGITASQRYNPHAMFWITHVTKYHEAVSSIGDFGSSIPTIDKSIWDSDIIPSQLTQQLSGGDDLFLNTPKDILERSCVGSYNPSEFDSSGFSPIPIKSFTTAKPTDAGFNSPTEHLSRLMTGLSTYVRVDNGYRAGSNNKLYGSENMLSDWGQQIEDYSETVNCTAHRKELQIDRSYSFEDINQMWPGSSLIVHKIEAPMNYSFGNLNVRDTGGPTRQNIATAIITSAMPTTLINRLVTDAVFSYSSYSTGGDMHNYKGICAIKYMMTLIPMDDYNYKTTALNLKRDIIDDVMQPIVANFGDVRCDVFCSVGGDTVVNLMLMDDYNDKGVSVTNNSLGGVGSGLMGNSDQCEHNAGQLRILGSALTSNPTMY